MVCCAHASDWRRGLVPTGMPVSMMSRLLQSQRPDERLPCCRWGFATLPRRRIPNSCRGSATRKRWSRRRRSGPGSTVSARCRPGGQASRCCAWPGEVAALGASMFLASSSARLPGRRAGNRRLPPGGCPRPAGTCWRPLLDQPAGRARHRRGRGSVRPGRAHRRSPTSPRPACSIIWRVAPGRSRSLGSRQ